MTIPRLSPPPVPPEKMTRRARAYLTAGAARAAALAAILLWVPGDLATLPLFAQVVAVAPIPAWGVAHVLVALILAHSAVWGSETVARLGLSAAAILAATWSACFTVVLADGKSAAPGVVAVAVVVFAALAVKDLIVCGQPLRSPLEPIIRRLSGE